MDVFSEILRGVVLKGALYFNAEFSAPWGFNTPPAPELAQLLSQDAPHLVIYHFVVEGAGLLRLADDLQIALSAGDVVIVTHGDSHEMCSAAGVGDRFSDAMKAKLRSHDLTVMQAGGGGDVARFVCGFMVCDPLLCSPILRSLPPAFKVNLRTDSAGQWLENLLLHLVEEATSGRAGSAAVLAKMSEALFVDTLRRYLAGLPEQEVGWLAAARDPIIGKSLMLLHSRTAHPWTIAELAKEVGSSRSALVERFTRYLAEPPMAYLMRWRLKLAARALGLTSRGVADIAEEVGYESEAAFNRAFKREFGLPPARYRREQRDASGDV
ncbi:MAG TPA: AraC family transcriptional regulator [Pyrinomonadaceae bacterium]|nr:AraC family transcriptional regulator [Pyrinomonadaceae bacterium]